MEKHTWCSEYIEQKTLADTIEEFMVARGEYDFYFDDRIRWLKTDDRKGNAKFILSEIQNDNIGYLIDYFKDQLAEMCEEDDLIPVAEDIINDLRKFREGMIMNITLNDLRRFKL